MMLRLFHECLLPGCRNLVDAPEPCQECLSTGVVFRVGEGPRYCPLLVQMVFGRAA